MGFSVFFELFINDAWNIDVGIEQDRWICTNCKGSAGASCSNQEALYGIFFEMMFIKIRKKKEYNILNFLFLFP